MKDRIPKDPGRVMISPENGSTPFYATVTRADNPEQEGTPLNKNSLLKDVTAALFGLGADAVPDDVLTAIKSALDTHTGDIASKAKIASGTYKGTGKQGASNKNSLTFNFEPKIVVIEGIQSPVVFVNGADSTGHTISASNTVVVYAAWSGNTLSWYNASSPNYQMNEANATYHYAAIG